MPAVQKDTQIQSVINISSDFPPIFCDYIFHSIKSQLCSQNQKHELLPNVHLKVNKHVIDLLFSLKWIPFHSIIHLVNRTPIIVRHRHYSSTLSKYSPPVMTYRKCSRIFLRRCSSILGGVACNVKFLLLYE